MTADLQIEMLRSPPGETDAAALADILHACVLDGASVGFVLPFAVAAAREYWEASVFADLTPGSGRRLFLARTGGETVGTVQLILAGMPNQTHRADVSKMLVHPRARRRGVAARLLAALEAQALAEGRTMLVLDTLTGDVAEGMYAKLGYETAGRIPDYARDTRVDELRATTVMYRRLGGG